MGHRVFLLWTLLIVFVKLPFRKIASIYTPTGIHKCISVVNTRWPNLNKQFYFIKINLFVFFKPFFWFDCFSCSSKILCYFSSCSYNDRWKLEDPEASVCTRLNNFPLETSEDQPLWRESRFVCISIPSTRSLISLR